MSREIVVMRVEPGPIAAVRVTTAFSQWPKQFSKALGIVYDAIHSGKIQQNGQNVMVYRPRGGDSVEIECGVQVATKFETIGEVVYCETPGGTAATLVHVGPTTNCAQAIRQSLTGVARRGAVSPEYLGKSTATGIATRRSCKPASSICSNRHSQPRGGPGFHWRRHTSKLYDCQRTHGCVTSRCQRVKRRFCDNNPFDPQASLRFSSAIGSTLRRLFFCSQAARSQLLRAAVKGLITCLPAV
jgi:hypothetical protein